MSNLNPSQFGDQYDTVYHLTDKRNFKPNAKKVPQDNTFALQERNRPGLYVGDAHGVEHWWNGSGYHRPYVAEIKVPKGVAQQERWGGEKFIPGEHLSQAQVSRVIPSDAFAREQYQQPGWVESHHGTSFDTGEPVNDRTRFPGYHYDGPDAREFTPEQHREQVKRVRAYSKYTNDPRNH
jgi:hypothetical protein